MIDKARFDTKKQNAMGHVRGYTIINEVTTRERQRDHNQIFIRNSGDTYCPMVGLSENI